MNSKPFKSKQLQSIRFSKKKKSIISFRDFFFTDKKTNDFNFGTKMKLKKKSQKIPFLSGYALKTGIHIGHKSLRLSKGNFWHPLMSEYFLGIRNGISIIDPIQTQRCLLRAFYVIASVINKRRNGNILIINTNPEFSRLCKNLSVLTLHNDNSQNIIKKNSSLSLVHYKWVGGTLTNWKQVSKSVLNYAKFAERCENFLYRNNIDFPKYKKIKQCFHGLITKTQGKMYLAFNEKPDLVFLMNPNENRHVIAEANKMNIPVIALVESNTNLKGIYFPIPANAYSAFFIYYCIKKIIKLTYV